MKKKLLPLSIIGLLFFALASGAHATANLDPANSGGYHFTWGANGVIDHVFLMEGDLVPSSYDNSWNVINVNLGNDWSITVTQASNIDLISVWQKPDIQDRVTFEVFFDGGGVAWTSTNAGGPFLGSIENLFVPAGTHTISIVAESDDGGAFAKFSGIPAGPSTPCDWNLEQAEGGDSDIDGLDLFAALGHQDIPAQLAAFAQAFGRVNCSD